MLKTNLRSRYGLAELIGMRKVHLKCPYICFVKWLLFPFSILYSLILAVRNRLYDIRFYKVYFHAKPTIGIGNLALGGTGKTPMTEYLIRLLSANYVCATLSRGYGRSTKGFRVATEADTALTIGDEPSQIHQKFENVSVVVSESRTEGLETLSSLVPKHEVVLLDDVFQHRGVKPGLNILLTVHDAPYFRDYVVPMGRLRESNQGAKRADIIVVTKCPQQMTSVEISAFKKHLNPLKHQSVFFSKQVYHSVLRLRDKTIFPIEHLTGRKVVLISGLASANSLVSFINERAELVKHFEFGDHHNFASKELKEILAYSRQLDHEQTLILTTEKDAERLRILPEFEKFADLSSYVIPLEISFHDNGDTEFQKRILDYVKSNS